MGNEYIYLVEYSNYDEHAVDSVWVNKARAEERAAKLNNSHLGAYWDVVDFILNEPDGEL